MELGTILAILQGWLFILILFGVSLGFAMFKGRQNLINLMMGMYVGLLLLNLFPFRDQVLGKVSGDKGKASVEIGIFLAFSIFGMFLFGRLMPREWMEGTFEAIGKKLLLAVASTVLLMTLSIHYLPIDVLINTGTPLPQMLLTENLAYLWLILPLIAMFVI